MHAMYWMMDDVKWLFITAIVLADVVTEGLYFNLRQNKFQPLKSGKAQLRFKLTVELR